MAHPSETLRTKIIRGGLAGIAILGMFGCGILYGGKGPIVDPTPGVTGFGEYTPTPTPTPTPLPHMLPEGPVRLA